MYLWAGHNSNMQRSYTWGPYCRGTTQRGFLIRVSSSHGKNKMSRWLVRGMLRFPKKISAKTKQNNPHILLFYSNLRRTKRMQGQTGLYFLAADQKQNKTRSLSHVIITNNSCPIALLHITLLQTNHPTKPLLVFILD